MTKELYDLFSASVPVYARFKNNNNKRLQTKEMKRKCKSFFVQQNKNFLWTRYEKKKKRKKFIKKRREKKKMYAIEIKTWW